MVTTAEKSPAWLRVSTVASDVLYTHKYQQYVEPISPVIDHLCVEFRTLVKEDFPEASHRAHFLELFVLRVLLFVVEWIITCVAQVNCSLIMRNGY